MIYHGSQVSGIHKLRTNYSGLVDKSVVYSTPNYLMALILGTGWRDDNINLGAINGKPYLKEVTEGSFYRFLTRPTYVYHLHNTSFHSHPNLCLFEYVSDIAHVPFGCDLIVNPLDLIRQAHVQLMWFQEGKPK
jgi:hypothetical protein